MAICVCDRLSSSSSSSVGKYLGQITVEWMNCYLESFDNPELNFKSLFLIKNIINCVDKIENCSYTDFYQNWKNPFKRNLFNKIKSV